MGALALLTRVGALLIQRLGVVEPVYAWLQRNGGSD